MNVFRRSWLPLVALALVSLLPGAAQAQPLGHYLILTGNTTSGGAGHGYVAIPHSPDLNPTGAITLEMWVRLNTPFTGQSCRSLIGKGFTQTYWVGVCGSTLRSYIKGSGSVRDGGTIAANTWTHIAVTSDGTTRRHFINGAQVLSSAELAGPIPTNTQPVRIGSDVSWLFSPQGSLDEVRLWNVARTGAEIQSLMFQQIVSPLPGLVTVWALNGNGQDRFAAHDGTLGGTTAFGTPSVPAGPWLSSPDMPDFRFKVRLTTAGVSREGVQESDCIFQTVCASGAIPGRPEVLLRVIGPRSNGYLWPIVIRFTNAQVETWVEQISTGQTKYYLLDFIGPDSNELTGINDRFGFLP
ncbi:MAG TPA: LamG domain-containing protein [Thermoanaerobaculia bacterium]|nr:LamG domain-containing protein [Thermoanaerobaculia bacterium]